MLGKNLKTVAAVEALPGIHRRTLVHGRDVMLCHFELKQGSKIPKHNHVPSQIGYVVSGRVKFISDRNPDGFIATSGDSYVFEPSEHHQAEVLEDSVFIEVFSPSRPEYV